MKAICSHNLVFLNSNGATRKTTSGESTYGGSGYALEIMSDCNTNMTNYADKVE